MLNNRITQSLIAMVIASTSAVSAAGGVTPVATTPSARTDDTRILHLLNRVTFGPTAQDVARVKKLGIGSYLQSQLNPASIAIPQSLTQIVQDSEAVSMPAGDLMTNYSRPAIRALATARGVSDKEEMQKEFRVQVRKLYEQMLKAKIARSVESPRQLEEVMTDFWFNHFNIAISKGQDRYLVGSFEEQAIRPHVLGKFRDLLGATAHHSAMLFYLDNWENTDPNSRAARGRFKGLNENYARELMELHTLGVDGGYSQKDVVALARILTGLGLTPARKRPMQQVPASATGVFFDQVRHDFGDKVLLGKTIKGSGEAEIEQALDMLAQHPATAHHLSFKLAQYFVNDNPSPQLVERLTKTYLGSHGDIKTVMSALFKDPEFWNSKNVAAKYKSPYRYVVSVLRASGTELDNLKGVDNTLRQLGQPLYGCLTPDGYKNTREAWLNSDGLLKRIAFASRVAAGAVGNVPPDQTERIQLILGSSLSQQTEGALASARSAAQAGLMLGCPEFMTY